MENNKIDTPSNLAPTVKLVPALCLDLDGTVRKSKSSEFIKDVNDIELIEGMPKLIWHYREMGYLIIGISNQGGVAYGFKRPSQIEKELEATFKLFGRTHPFHVVKTCYHYEGGGVEPFNHRSLFRKPNIGMLAEAEKDAWNAGFMINWDASLMVGDRLEDELCARNAGIAFMYVDKFLSSPHEFKIGE